MIKEKSILDDKTNMNLHEECLLKYLVNPLELFYTTEMLKNNNLLLEKYYCGAKDIIVENRKLKVENY